MSGGWGIRNDPTSAQDGLRQLAEPLVPGGAGAVEGRPDRRVQLRLAPVVARRLLGARRLAGARALEQRGRGGGGETGVVPGREPVGAPRRAVVPGVFLDERSRHVADLTPGDDTSCERSAGSPDPRGYRAAWSRDRHGRASPGRPAGPPLPRAGASRGYGATRAATPAS